MASDTDQIRTMVVKIGTNLLSGQRAFDGRVMEACVKEICALKHERDIDLLVVSSGAVGCGMNTLGLTKRPTALPLKQAVAAVGQSTLMHLYETMLKTYGQGLSSAQVLLTLADLDNRQTYLNVRNTLRALFDIKTVVPIINENDSTAVEELRFSDNDTLAAKIAAKINADLLIILTDVDGLFDRNPAAHREAQLIPEVREITSEMTGAAGGAGSVASTGGMRTKLDAARIACAAGVPVVIANGYRSGIIHGILDGSAPHTRFTPAKTALPHRKRWIAFGRASRGSLRIDDGARNALIHRGKSLLAAGVVAVDGEFHPGDAVRIVDAQGHDLGRGLVNYDSRELRLIQGRHSKEITAILGHKDFDEVVHRDNLALL
jgi:glutamate 5-kinase